MSQFKLGIFRAQSDGKFIICLKQGEGDLLATFLFILKLAFNSKYVPEKSIVKRNQYTYIIYSLSLFHFKVKVVRCICVE